MPFFRTYFSKFTERRLTSSFNSTSRCRFFSFFLLFLLAFSSSESSVSDLRFLDFLSFLCDLTCFSGVGEREGTGEGGQMDTVEFKRCCRRLLFFLSFVSRLCEGLTAQSNYCFHYLACHTLEKDVAAFQIPPFSLFSLAVHIQAQFLQSY